jgi:hypothetical protein
MLKSPHALKLVGSLFIIFSFFVVYSTFSGNPLFSNSDQQAQLVTGVTSPTSYLQVFVMAGASPLSPTNPPTTAYSYMPWIADNTLNPPISKRSSFRIARSSVTSHYGLSNGILFDQATTTGTGTISVWVPKIDGYEARGYIYTSAFSGLNEDKTVHQPISPFTIGGGRINGSNLTDYYFNFPLFADRFTRLIIFYERQPVACRNIMVDLVETKRPDGHISFTLSSPAVATAKDLSYLVSPYNATYLSVPNYLLETRRSFTTVVGTFNLDSHRFTIIDDFSNGTSSKNTLGPIKEIGSVIVPVVVPFDQGISSIWVRENKAGETYSIVTVGPFPTSCPATCKLEFEIPDFSSGDGRCCAGLTTIEDEGQLVCTKI